MGCAPDYLIRAQFHEEYLKEMFREHRLSYNKAKPKEVSERYYLEELVKRNRQTGHLPTFGDLIELWRRFGGVI